MRKIDIDNYIYRIVTKDCDFKGFGKKSKYKKGDVIRYNITDNLDDDWGQFIEENSIMATEKEAQERFNLEYSNAAIGQYGLICHYFIPTVEIKNIYELKQYGIESNIYIKAGPNGEYLFTEYEEKDWEDKVLTISRRATPEETKKINDEIIKQGEIKREKYRLEEKAKEKAKQERFEANKNNPEYYPGSCGNYKQVIINENGKIDETKLYDLYTIKQFYNELINSGKIDKELLEKIILYGGTVPYILLDTKEETRKFGDVDIFIPIENMAMFRQTIINKSYFNMSFDSMVITEKARLRAAGCKPFERPWFMGDNSDFYAYNAYEEKVSKLLKEHQSKMVYQDYGFKGTLFGVNISVFPIYQWDKDNKLDICAKSFRIGKEAGDSKFLLNTIVTHNTPTTSFSKIVEICGGKIGTANLEYTIASKKNAINHGYLLRKDTDLMDLDFIEQNKDKLGIDDNLTKHYETNIPDYGIVKVYRKTRSNEIAEYTPEEYKHIVTKNHKPS
ncbi:MAG: hypothetical protein PHQ89_00070 [Bacilli bacterium]|nr:hypothetical protein [Bacilli bacterium]